MTKSKFARRYQSLESQWGTIRGRQAFDKELREQGAIQAHYSPHLPDRGYEVLIKALRKSGHVVFEDPSLDNTYSLCGWIIIPPQTKV